MATPEPLAVGKCLVAASIPETSTKSIPASLAISAKRNGLGSWGRSVLAGTGARFAIRSPRTWDEDFAGAVEGFAGALAFWPGPALATAGPGTSGVAVVVLQPVARKEIAASAWRQHETWLRIF